jgi:phosphoribosyl 1,2-cyclic phosphodiesterase
MTIHSINSGSSGNSYVLEIDGSYLLLDCGVAYQEIAKTIDFKMSRIVGCLLTHEHGDHSKSANELIRRGLNVYTSKGTRSKVNSNCIHVENLKEFRIEDFTIIPFDVPHDAEEPFGFLIRHEKIGLLAFITDAMYCKYTFPGLRHVLIEANYSDESMTIENDYLKQRIKKSHMSIDTCCDFILANSQTLETITLLHLSDSNSNQEEFEQKIRQISGVRVYIAEKNKKINLEI